MDDKQFILIKSYWGLTWDFGIDIPKGSVLALSIPRTITAEFSGRRGKCLLRSLIWKFWEDPACDN